MSLSLYRFDADPRGIVFLTPRSYSELAAVLQTAYESELEIACDLDPRWRELLLYTKTPDPGDVLRPLLEEAGLTCAFDIEGPFRVETPRDPGKASVTRSYKVGDKVEKAIFDVSVARGSANGGLVVDGLEGVTAPVVEHAIRRAALRSPGRGYPIVDALFQVTTSFGAEDPAPSLAEAHSAGLRAGQLALGEARTLVLDPDTRQPNGEPAPHPDLETSVAETVLNLRQVCAWPLQQCSAEEAKQVEAFVTYLASLLYGHAMDERMQRCPALPPAALHPFLAQVTDDLMASISEPGKDVVATGLVTRVVEAWTAEWRPQARA